MTRKFTNIICVYYDDHNYIPAKFSCPDLEIDDVMLPLTKNVMENYEIISELLVDYAFAIFCNKAMSTEEFVKDNLKFKRSKWKLLEFKDTTNNESKGNKEDDESTSTISDSGKRGNGRKS